MVSRAALAVGVSVSVSEASTNQPGLVAIYRWRVADAHLAAFTARWERATRRLAGLGGMGSLLGRAQTGELVAVALWPSAAARDAAFAEASDEGEWPPAERLEPILVETIANLWEPASDA